MQRVSFHSACDDCGVDTMNEVREYYMVHDRLWRNARRRGAKRKLPRTATLCIGCLEERLARKLTPEDFQYVFDGSERLLDRAKGLHITPDPIITATDARVETRETTPPERLRIIVAAWRDRRPAWTKQQLEKKVRSYKDPEWTDTLVEQELKNAFSE
jgi:hypothetical protein